MITISKPLSAAQVRTYHTEEFSNARENYYAAGDEIRTQWHGQLARQWGLSGAVRDDHFQRLADGQHPLTGAPLVRPPRAQAYTNEHGERVAPMAHRAGWDATISAPKSVSLTALVGGDARVREAHRASVGVALDEMERYVQARIGHTHPAETTGKWVAATFEHDSARPVDGYAAPQLHTHVVFFNVTARENGETRALQPRELYKTQQYGTAVYRSELATRLTGLGYDIERGASGQPEIRGYTAVYLEASSPRRHQIEMHLAQAHQSGAGAAQIAAHRTREAKRDYAHAEMQQRHQELARAFGDQPARVVAAARARLQHLESPASGVSAHEAVTFAKERNLEREAVVDERALLRDALRRSMGEVPVATVRAHFEDRVQAGEFLTVAQRPGHPGRAFTTPEMITLEEDTIRVMRDGRDTRPPLVRGVTREELERTYPRLTHPQRTAVTQILQSRDRIVALEGVAGAGKTTALAAVRDAVEREGFRVEGLAPTSRAVDALTEAGIPAGTLQRHVRQHEGPSDGRPRLYVLDESSLASTKLMHDFLQRLASRDRVLLVGDVRQHQAVEAGRPYEQLQQAGVHTVRLDAIVRQRDPALKQVVEHLANGDVRRAVYDLDRQGRIHEIPGQHPRLQAIADAYLEAPTSTLVVSPDNHSRQQINALIHHRLQQRGQVAVREQPVPVLVPRQEITGVDRQWAGQYGRGDVVRYTVGSRTLGLRAGEYTRVADVDIARNRLTVTRGDGTAVEYDPRRVQGVTIYREASRHFAMGDRVQFTAPYRDHRVANRDLGTIRAIHPGGRVQIQVDGGRTLSIPMTAPQHLDYGYAVTSHSSQGQTADRVLVHVDTERLGEQLVNRRLAYVAISRGRYDAQIYTNDKTQVGEALSRDVSHQSALRMGGAERSHAPAATPARHHAVEVTVAREGHGR